jgi:tetratricopeptide (TPR) repeat protein
MLARTHSALIGYGLADSDVTMDVVRTNALKALELDDSLPEVHVTLGWYYLGFAFDWEKAGKAFRKAHELAPGDGRALVGLANYEGCCGDLATAVRLADESVHLDPLNPSSHVFAARVYLWAGEFSKARRYTEKALELAPGFAGAWASIAASYLLEGRTEEALAAAQKEAPSGYQHTALAGVYHALGRKEDSDRALAALKAEGDHWGYQISTAHAMRGESDQAFHWLERSYSLNDPGIQSSRVQPSLRSLHSDPRWPEFLRRIGLLR